MCEVLEEVELSIVKHNFNVSKENKIKGTFSYLERKSE